MEDRNFKLMGFCIVGFFILYLIMAGILAMIKIRKLRD